jgi:hypothetical protein
MINSKQQQRPTNNLTIKIQDYRNSIVRRVSRLDPDIISFIRNGFLLIPIANFSKDYAESIRNEYKFRSALIDCFIFAIAREIQNANQEIKISILSVSFDEVMDEFSVSATINRPTEWEIFLLDELMRVSALEASDLHGIDLSVQAALRAMNDLNCSDVLTCSSDACH